MGRGTWKNSELTLLSTGQARGWGGGSQFSSLGAPQRPDMKHVKKTVGVHSHIDQKLLGGSSFQDEKYFSLSHSGILEVFQKRLRRRTDGIFIDNSFTKREFSLYENHFQAFIRKTCALPDSSPCLQVHSRSKVFKIHLHMNVGEARLSHTQRFFFFEGYLSPLRGRILRPLCSSFRQAATQVFIYSSQLK